MAAPESTQAADVADVVSPVTPADIKPVIVNPAQVDVIVRDLHATADSTAVASALSFGSSLLAAADTNTAARDALIKLAERLVKCRYDSSDDANAVKDLLVDCVQLIAKQIDSGDAVVYDGLTRIFNLENPLFMYHGFAVNANGLTELEEEQAWRAALQVGDWIDARHQISKCWHPARVVEISDRGIVVRYDNMNPTTNNRLVPRDSPDLAPKDSRAVMRVDLSDPKEQWRLTLMKGSMCDCVDTVNKWYRISVVNLIERDVRFVRVTYHAWTDRYDEDIAIDSYRLQPLNSRAVAEADFGLGGAGDPGLLDINEDADPADPAVFAVFRTVHYGSRFVPELLNVFGAAGGFDRIIRRLQVTDDASRPKLNELQALITALSNVTPLLARAFSQQYIPHLQTALFANLLTFSDAQVRNLTREGLEAVGKAARGVLKRIYGMKEVTDALKDVSLKMALKLFESPFLSLRVFALKMVMDAIKSLSVKTATQEQRRALCKWFVDGRLLQAIFNPATSHVELMSRTKEIIQYMIQQQGFTTEHLDVIWAPLFSDQETTLVICNLIDSLYLEFPPPLISHLVDKLAALPVSAFTEELVALVRRLTALGGASNTGPQCMNLLWSICQADDSVQPGIVAAAKRRLIELLTLYQQREERVPFMLTCMDLIKSGRSVPTALEVLWATIDSFRGPATPGVMQSKAEVVKMLQESSDLLGALFADIVRFKDQAIAAAVASGLATRDAAGAVTVLDEAGIDNMIVKDRLPYVKQLAARLEFLTNALSGTPVQLTGEQLEGLWQSLHSRALTQEERRTFLKWLANACASKATCICDPAAVEQVFQTHFTNTELDAKHTSIDAFRCLRSCFNLIAIRKEWTEPVDEHGFAVIVEPQTLAPVATVWRIIMEAADTDVGQAASSFLIDLHTQLSPVLAESQDRIMSDFVATIMQRLQAANASHDYVPVMRCLQLLDKLLEVFDKDGNAGLRAHAQRLRGKAITLRTELQVASRPQNVPANVNFHMFSNATVWDVRAQVAAKIAARPDQIRLWRAGEELPEVYNSKTLAEMEFPNNMLLSVTLKLPTVARRVALLVDDRVPDQHCVLTTRAKAAFTYLFKRFSHNNAMTSEDLCTYFLATKAPPASTSPERLAKVLKEHPCDADGNLTLEGFLSYYKQSCKRSPATVWADLTQHGFNHALDIPSTDGAADAAAESNTSGHPRALLAHNQEYFEQLFSILSAPSVVAERAWSLLMRLPTNPVLLSNLRSLDAVKTVEPDWVSLLDNSSPFRLLYALQIIEMLVEPSTAAEHGVTAVGASPMPSDAQLAPWITAFVSYGGFKHLYHSLMVTPWAATILTPRSGTPASPATESAADQAMSRLKSSCLGLLLSLVRYFVMAALAVTKPQVSLLARARSQLGDLMDTASPGPDGDDTAAPVLLSPQPAKDDKDGMPPGETTAEYEGAGEMKESEIPQTPIGDAAGAPADVTIPPTPVPAAAGAANGETDSPVSQSDVAFLVQVLSENCGRLADIIKTDVTFADLQDRLLDLLWAAAQTGGKEDTDLITHGVALWVAIMVHDSQLFGRLAHDERGTTRLSALSEALLFCEQSVRVRREFAHGIYALCTHVDTVPPPRHFFADLLLTFLPSQENPAGRVGSQCEQYFDLLNRLLSDRFDGALTDSRRDTASLFMALIATVRQLPFTERRDQAGNDKTLTGLLATLTTLAKHDPALGDVAASNNLVKELYDLLFQLPASASDLDESLHAAPPKCKSAQSRTAAYGLLATLCSSNLHNLIWLCDLIEPLHGQATQVTKWKYSFAQGARSPTGYVGMKNLGCICYMNSVLQQFYMIPRFRWGILAVDDAADNEVDSVLGQLQNMFASLALSERQAYVPEGWCQAFKDSAGRPVQVTVQQDAEEFLNGFVDRTEALLRTTEQRDLVRSLATGYFVNQIICQSCAHIRELPEAFHHISIEVKNFNNIHDSMSQFVSGETISDYECGACHKKVDIVKRACVLKLPPLLVVHFKRLKFNLETLANEKINSRFEFPATFNIKPYTKEGLAAAERVARARPASEVGADAGGKDGVSEEVPEPPVAELSTDVDAAGAAEGSAAGGAAQASPSDVRPDEYYQYRLAGVLIHSGESADSGHYYSYIKDRVTGQWNEFNDSVVRPFNFDTELESKCFGGPVDRNAAGWDDNVISTNAKGERTANAYMLFYERVMTPEQAKAVDDSLGLTESATTSVGAAAGTAEAVVTSPAARPISDSLLALAPTHPNRIELLQSIVPPKIFQRVFEDNVAFFRDQQVYSAEHFNFMVQVCQAAAKLVPVSNDYTVVPPMPNTPDAAVEHVLDLATSFWLDILAHAANIDKPFAAFGVALSNLYTKRLRASLRLLLRFIERPAELKSLLLKCSNEIVREHVSKLFVAVLQRVVPVEESFFSDEEPNPLVGETPASPPLAATRPRALSARFITMLFDMLPEAAEDWPRFKQFFETIRALTGMGRSVQQMLINRGYFTALCDFYLGDESPVRLPTAPKTGPLGNQMMRPAFEPLIATVVSLALACRTPATCEEGDHGARPPLPPPTCTTQSPLQLSRADSNLVRSQVFYASAFQSDKAVAMVADLLSHHVWQDRDFTETVSSWIITGLETAASDQWESFWTIIKRLIVIQDSLQLTRIASLLGDPYAGTTHAGGGLGLSPVEFPERPTGDRVDVEIEATILRLSLDRRQTTRGIGKGLVDLMYRRRTTHERFVYICIKNLLDTTELTPLVVRYLAGLGPQNPMLEDRYVDWMWAFLERYVRGPSRHNQVGPQLPDEDAEADATFLRFEHFSKLIDNEVGQPRQVERLDVPTVLALRRAAEINNSYSNSVWCYVVEYTDPETGRTKVAWKVTSEQKSAIAFSITISNGTPNEPLNFELPAQQPVETIMPPQSYKIVFSAFRRDETRPTWGAYKYNWKFEAVPSVSAPVRLALASDEPERPEPARTPAAGPATAAPGPAPAPSASQQPPRTPVSQNTQARSEWACAFCTFLNPITSNVCEMCSSLRS